MDKIFLVLLCVLPFSALIFNKVDIWHGHGQFFQLGILVLLCGSLFKKNKPLACFILWAGIVTAMVWYAVMVATKNYATTIFFPFFNLLCFVLFYKFSVEYLNEKEIENILKWLGRSVILVIVYCFLQKLNLDQFYSPLSPTLPDELVGTIGNTSHLAGYLALCQPLFFKKGWLNYIILGLLWVILLMAKSASGIIAGLGIVLFWLLIKKRYKLFGTFVSLISVIGIYVWVFYREFFTFSHRLEIWQLLFNKFKVKPITGYGLGILNTFNIQLGGQWRHAHQEYYQIAIELGLIGLALVLWCIVDYFRVFRTIRTDLTIRLASIFFGFCVLSMFTFPAHLFLLASLGMLSYSWLYVLKNEVI